MTRIVNTIGIAPKQETPVNNPAQQTQKAKQTTQQPKVTSNNPFGLENVAKLGAKIYKFSNAGIWGGGTALGSFTAGGAASGAVTAGGGTYVTGSGLAGSASAINTTAGAAGKVGSVSKLGGMNGLASAGIGMITSAIGQNFFGGYGGTGASLGSAIGSIWGPAGAAIGGLFGGAIGGIFGGDEKRAFVGVMQGGGGHVKANKYQTKYNTVLGSVTVSTDNIPGEARKKIGKMFQDSDAQVAQLFNEDQLQRAKMGILNASSTNRYTSWGKSGKSERANAVFEQAFLDRYAGAVGGLDPNYYGTFKRVADKKNMGSVVATMAQLDKDISSRYGIFKDFNPVSPSEIIADDDPRIKPTLTKKQYVSGGWGKTKEITYNNPNYDPQLHEVYRQQQASRRVIGYEKYMKTETGIFSLGGGSNQTRQVEAYRPVYEDTPSGVGNQALDFLAEKYDLGNRPKPPKYKVVPVPQYSPIGGGVMSWSSSAAEEHNKKLRESYNKKLGAWEKKVLDAYVDNYSQSVMMASADNLVTLSQGITRENNQPAQPQASQTGLLSQANTPAWTGGVQTNAAQPVTNDATNAGILKNRG